ncbi:hypothetical protein ABPG72_016572 [Tetrahymena utriculariae]
MQKPEASQLEELLKQAIEENEILRDRVAELEALLVAAQEEIEKRDEAIRELVQNNNEMNDSQSQEFSNNKAEEDIQSMDKGKQSNRHKQSKITQQANEEDSDEKSNNQDKIINVSNNISEASNRDDINEEDSDATQNKEEQDQKEIRFQYSNQSANQPIYISSQQSNSQNQQQNNSQNDSDDENHLQQAQQLDFANIKKRIKKFKK